MPTARYARAALGIVFVLSAGACVTLPPNSQRAPQDPWESWNRGVYKFNDALDRGVAKPVARTYVRIVPKPVRTGVSNFFSNLDTPTVMVNDALQGKLLAAASDLGRFVLNSTFGLAGLSLMGVPPSGGFVAKWLLLSATVMEGQWWWGVVMLVGGLLAGGYVFRVLGKAFGGAGTPLKMRAPVSRRREVVALTVALCAILLGLVPLQPSELLQVGRPTTSAVVLR